MENRNSFKRTIRKDLFMILLMGLILPFCLMIYLYSNNMKTIINNKVIAYQKVILNQASDNLKNIFSSIKIVQRAIISKVISNYMPLKPGNPLSKDNINKLKEIIEHLIVLDNANPYVNGIYVILESDYVISSRNGFTEQKLLHQKWIKAAWESKGKEIISAIHPAEYNVGTPLLKYDQVVSFVQKIKLPQKQETPFLILIDIDVSVLQHIVDSVEYKEQMPVSIMNSKTDSVLLTNSIFNLYNKEKSRIESEIIEEIKEDHIFLHAFIRKDQISQIFSSSIFGTAVLLVVIIIVGGIAAFFLSRSITTPMHQLYLCMRKVGQGNFSPEYPATNYNELQYLITHFQKMVSEIDRLIETVVRKESEAVEAELEALQAKINPHFLYNTLDVIRGMAMENDDERIADMTLSLSRLFRYHVSELGEITSVEKELMHIQDYIKIQSYRFGDRINVTMNIQEELKNVKIIRFVLQPIIENAFKHGLELRGKGGMLDIAADKCENNLNIVIEDNGIGIDMKNLTKLKKSLVNESPINTIKTAHGLANVNLRIKLTYGSDYGIDIDSEKNEWTKITIKLPILLE